MRLCSCAPVSVKKTKSQFSQKESPTYDVGAPDASTSRQQQTQSSSTSAYWCADHSTDTDPKQPKETGEPLEGESGTQQPAEGDAGRSQPRLQKTVTINTTCDPDYVLRQIVRKETTGLPLSRKFVRSTDSEESVGSSQSNPQTRGTSRSPKTRGTSRSPKTRDASRSLKTRDSSRSSQTRESSRSREAGRTRSPQTRASSRSPRAARRSPGTEEAVGSPETRQTSSSQDLVQNPAREASPSPEVPRYLEISKSPRISYYHRNCSPHTHLHCTMAAFDDHQPVVLKAYQYVDFNDPACRHGALEAVYTGKQARKPVSPPRPPRSAELRKPGGEKSDS
ncbi:hypothetical protein ACOMHN_023625 [Nucella lapillus]